MTTLTRQAVALADLMTIAEEIGAAARVDEDGVFLVGPADAAPRRIGGSLEEAAASLRALCARDGANVLVTSA